MPIGAPKDISDIRRFFFEADQSKQRQYEAFRAYFIENKPVELPVLSVTHRVPST